MTDPDETLLKNLFYNFDSNELFASRQKLYDALKRQKKRVALKFINDFLSTSEVATLFKQRPKQTAVKRRITGTSLFSELISDLADFSSLKSKNRGFCFLCVTIDAFSHFLFLHKIKKKNKSCMTEVFKDILENPPVDKNKVKFLFSDEGNEYRSLIPFLSSYGVKLIHNTSKIKAHLAEITIRHLQRPLFKLLHYLKSLNWIDLVDLLAKKHNETKTPALFGFSPVEIVYDRKKREQYRLLKARDLLKFYKRNSKSPSFAPGDEVRYLLPRKQFSKAYLPAYSVDTAIVVGLKPTIPIQYELVQKQSGKPIRKKFYDYQLSLVRQPQITDEDDLKASFDSKRVPNEEEKRKKGVPDDLGVRRSLYIDQSRLASSRTLRSGRETSQKKEYVIKDARDPKFVQIVDEAGLEKLKKDERLISDTI